MSNFAHFEVYTKFNFNFMLQKGRTNCKKNDLGHFYAAYGIFPFDFLVGYRITMFCVRLTFNKTSFTVKKKKDSRLAKKFHV